MAAGGRRPLCPPGALLRVAAVVVAAGWVLFPMVRAEPKGEQSIDLIEKTEVYGDTSHEGQRNVNLTETGELMVMGFRESMSGAYTCTLSHKIIETTTQEEAEMVETYKFMVYGKIVKLEADHAYQVSVRFNTTDCKLKTNGLFIESLKQILNSDISFLTCHITELSYKCHSIKNGLQYELFVNFLVNPFARVWEDVCHKFPYDCEEMINRRVQQAAKRIGMFFHQQRQILEDELHVVPAVHYVDKSFSMTPIESCRPGFGKSHHSPQNCAGCCVVCGPGTYSPNNEVTCQTCARPHARMYGAKSCY